MVSRLLHVPMQGGLDALAELVRGRIAKDRSVLIVTASLPAGKFFEHFQDRGVDINRVFVVDAVSSRSGMDVRGDPEHVHFVPAPTLLELIAKRAEKIIKTKAQGPPHIIVFSANAFALYNEADALEELVRYVVNTLVHPKIRIDFVVEEGVPIPKRLLLFLESFLDETLRLTAPADAKP
ncbi:MAG: hypothetical protein AABY18_06145 [Candidatus Thermoplasmatota archaeon]